MIDPNKIFLSALLFTTFNDAIMGLSMDITSPILNKVLPGNISKPVQIMGINFYFTRFMVRFINLILAIAIVKYMSKKTNNINMIPFK